jgi:hypothetical protein
LPCGVENERARSVVRAEDLRERASAVDASHHARCRETLHGDPKLIGTTGRGAQQRQPARTWRDVERCEVERLEGLAAVVTSREALSMRNVDELRVRLPPNDVVDAVDHADSDRREVRSAVDAAPQNGAAGARIRQANEEIERPVGMRPETPGLAPAEGLGKRFEAAPGVPRPIQPEVGLDEPVGALWVEHDQTLEADVTSDGVLAEPVEAPA